jgi:N-acetylglutamate synthase-like GNAT family acetyltransferase
MSPDPQDITQVNLSFDFDTCELWISWLSVSTQLRLSGVGSQLVNVAETIARVIGIQIICVFPLVSTNTFWEKMGYVPYRRATRVLCKQLNLSPSTRADVASDRRCTCQGNGRTKWVSSADSTLLLP